MATSGACWGIEVGAAAIKAVKLEALGEGRCRVVDWALIPHPKVLSTPGVDPQEVLRVSLGKLVNEVDLSKAGIAISIPGHSSFARFAKLPPVDPKKVADIVKFEAAQQIPFPLEQVEWDYQTFVTPDSPDVEVGIFAVTKERVQERLQMLEDVGLTPNFVVLSPIAVYNALAYDLDFGASTPGTIIVDIGTTSTDLVIATPGRMWVRTFPLGGHNFTEALVSTFQTSYAKAEKLKREPQDSKNARQIFQAMRPVFTDLAQDIQRSIGYFQSMHRDAQLTRVIGVGATWQLPGLRKYLKQQLGLDVYRIDGYKKVGAAAAAGAGDDDEGAAPAPAPDAAAAGGDRAAQFTQVAMQMATAYGLALQGLGMNAVTGNLMPVQVLRRSMWKDKVKWFGLAAGLAVAASGAMFINPLRTHFGVTGAAPDPTIQQAVSRAQDVKRRADEAGVTSGGDPDTRGANLVALQAHRTTYADVVRDVQAMFTFAEQRKGTWAQAITAEGQTPPTLPSQPALDLDLIRTQYIPPVAEGTEEGSSANPLPEELQKYPAIEVTIQVRTGVPEPRRFLNDTVNRWLRDNARRDGVSYELVFVGENVQVVSGGAAPTGALAIETGSDRSATLGSSDRQQEETRGGPRGTRGGPTRQATPRGGGGSAGEGTGGGTVDNPMVSLAPPPGVEQVSTAVASYKYWLVFKPADTGAEGGAS